MKKLILKPDSRSRISLKKLNIKLADGYIPTVTNNGTIILTPVEITITEKMLDANPKYLAEISEISKKVDANPNGVVPATI